MFTNVRKKIKSVFTIAAGNKYKFLPLKVCTFYFIASFLWILFSDKIASDLFVDREMLLIANTYKGWVYVAVITVILYALMKSALNSLQKAEKELTESYSELSAAHEEIGISEDRLKRAQEIAHVGNWEMDIAAQTIWASEEAFRLYGFVYDSPYISLKAVQSVVHPQDRPAMDMALRQLITENKHYEGEFRILRENDQQERIMHSLAKLEFNDSGKPVKVLGVVRDITEAKTAELELKQSHEELTALYEELTASDEELRQQFDELSHHQTLLRKSEERLHKMAYHDSVTGLPNRLWLEEKITGIIENSPSNFAVLFIDLDNFKNINDSFGHFFGDAVLNEIGKMLTHVTEDNAIVARLGGDEFAVVLAGMEYIGEAEEYAQKLLVRLDTNFKRKEIDMYLSASIGVTIFPEHGTCFEELLKNADIAMYKAKNLGKNRYVFFNQEMNSEIYMKVAMESNLRAAIDKGELILYYQPVYDLKTRKISGFEALIRWSSPVYGMVMPYKFIPLAESSDLILQIGRWVLRTASRFISRFNSTRDEKLTVSVNISIRQLAHENFEDEVLEVLKEAGMEAEYLELEITESVLMEDVESKLEKIERLKNHGIRFALDDFGSGYSSLTYLRKLPISILKLDKGFIEDIENNKTDTDIARSIINLAHILELKVVGEGVETKEQFDCLDRYDCDVIQGYYISRPLPEDELGKVIDRT